jgi:YHS domain-containing protein
MRVFVPVCLLVIFLAGCVVSDPAPARRPVVVDPVCGAAVDLSTPWRGRFRGQEFYFHSEYCREAFYNDPEAYLGSPYGRVRHPGVPGREVAYYRDPVCGRDVAISTPWWGYYQGQPYSFHSDQCRVAFQSHPESYVGRYRNPSPHRYETR